jgi:YD repeat-containing protein
MHALNKTLLGATALALSFVSQAHAASLVTVTPPSGAVETFVFGINSHNVITGSYLDADGVEHGFFGPLNGDYTTFDYGGTSTGTEPRSISDTGTINGFASDPNFTVGAEFFRKTDGTIETFMKDGVALDGVAQGVSKRGSSTGDYIDPVTGIRTGYLGKNGKYTSDLDLALGATRTSPRAINKSGALAGFFVDSGGVTHGFILDNGVVQVIDADESGTTSMEGLNKKGFASLQVVDADGNPHSMTYDSGSGEFTTIDVPDGSTYQQAYQVNDKGLVAVITDVGAYIYCPKAAHCPDGARDIGEGRSWHAKPGSAFVYDRNGRTGVKPAKIVQPVRGAKQ